MTFRDHFSQHAAEYAKFRPSYPQELFRFLANEAPANKLAWDCATGNGQAARGLADYFEHVIATDGSSAQIEMATAHPKIEFCVATAEATEIASVSCDLVTAATAAHWFNLDHFYSEAKRVMKPGGVIALFHYGATYETSVPAVSELIERYSRQIVAKYYDPLITRLWDGYKALPFPFNEFAAPEFALTVNWDFSMMMGYLLTLSATQNYIRAHGCDPRELLRSELENAWGSPDAIVERKFKIDLRIGRSS